MYFDLRTLGSVQGVFSGEALPPYERAARLLVDLLYQFHDDLLNAALNDNELIGDVSFTSAIDDLSNAISSVRYSGTPEVEEETEAQSTQSVGGGISVSLSASPSVGADLRSDKGVTSRARRTERTAGTQLRQLNFSDVAGSLRRISDALKARRIWLLLDEWSSIGHETQPYLAEFVVRCITPLPKFVVKIAAIEQQSNFRERLSNGTYVGLELGADISANVNLDDFMVFESNQDAATEFFQDLFYKHLANSASPEAQLHSASDVVRHGFTDRRSFQELVRAAEGVPRDAINVAAKAALRAATAKIAVSDVRIAARQWFQSDKEAAVRNLDQVYSLLNWIVDRVIRGRKARAFLVDQRSVRDSLLSALFDARLLHVVRRGYSAKDQPGVRYDIFAIDYGTYVDLIGTKSEVILDDLRLFELTSNERAYDVEVPTQDLRAIRRNILELDDFYRSIAPPASTPS